MLKVLCLKKYVQKYLQHQSLCDSCSIMFENLAIHQFRCQVHLLQRNSFYKAYCFEWDEKRGCAIPLRNGRKYRLFQIIYFTYTFPILPVSLFRTLQIFTSSDSEHGPLETEFACAFTIFIWSFVPYSWVFMKYSGASKFVKIFEATITLDKSLSGTNLNPVSQSTSP